jgi:hypothetical protein
MLREEAMTSDAMKRLTSYGLLGKMLEDARRRNFDQAVEDAYRNPAVVRAIVEAVGDAYIKAKATPDVLVNLTVGSASEWVIAASAVRDVLGLECNVEKDGLASTFELENGSAICVRCKTEPQPDKAQDGT